ncbi:MAG: alpha-ketoacid dehydrogenase subunit beta [Vulcanimicrobiaceae bacterium]
MTEKVATTTMTIAQAAREALAEEMRRDPSVWALGEDLAAGGIFGTYKGLIDEFGPERIVSTPISESMIMNVGFGAALAGTRPVIEMRILDFALCAWDELINQIAKARFMFGGQTNVPLVVRMPQGIGRGFQAAQHSQSLEAWLVHTPGLVVIAPATAADEKGMLKTAIRSDDPVVLLDPKSLFATNGDVPGGDYTTPFGVARIAREGRDATLVTWSSLVPAALDAAERAQAEGISVEVIDLRSLWPWDRDAVLASAAKSRRVLVAHEAVRVGGLGAEIAATVNEELGIPVARAGAPRIPVGYAPVLENTYRMDAEKILESIRKTVVRR